MQPVIKLSNVNYRADNRNILSDVNLSVNRGDFLAITGPNGGGKTTLLRIILHLLKPTTGSAQYFDQNGNPTDSLHIGYLPQKNSIDSHFPITVREVISSGLLAVKNLTDSKRTQRVDEIIHTIELDDHASKPIGNLSGGQLQRTLLGRALISRPPILILDEPLSYIDKHFEQHIYHIIQQVATSTTILLVSHDMSVVATMANRHIIVDGTLHDCTAHRHFVHTECG